MTKEEVKRLIDSSSAPEGVLAEGDNGKLYFLDGEQEQELALHPSERQIKLRREVLQKMGSKGTIRPDVSFCDGLEGWLTKHSIFADGWGDIAEWYLREC